MDERAIVDRAELLEDPGDRFPNRSTDAPRWLAEEPETDCLGVGHFELEACVNLVHAVVANRKNPETAVLFVTVGCGETFEMRWLGDGCLGHRLRDVLLLSRSG